MSILTIARNAISIPTIWPENYRRWRHRDSGSTDGPIFTPCMEIGIQV